MVGRLTKPRFRNPKFYGGPNFIHPTPTPENTLLGVGGCIKEGGAYKIPVAGGSKYTPPPLSREKAFWPKWGGGGGVYNSSLDKILVNASQC